MTEDIILRTKCPVCNSTSSRSIFSRSFNEEIIREYMSLGYQGNANIEFLKDINFEIVKCNECNLSYQKYILDESRLSELYNTWIDPKLAQKWNENGKMMSRRANAFILNAAKKLIRKEAFDIKVLDYGAGFGDLLVLAKEMGFDTYAYEYSTERIRSLNELGIKTINDDNEELFDFIVVNQVIEHLTYPSDILEVLIRKLKKKGVIYLAVPSCPQIEKKLKETGKIINAKEFHKVLLDASVVAFQHINFFNNYNFKLYLKNFGLKRISPFNVVLFKPVNIKYLILPFYNYYFRTSFFLKKMENNK